MDTKYIAQDIKDNLRMKVLNELKERYRDIPELVRCIDIEVMEYELTDNKSEPFIAEDDDMYSRYYRSAQSLGDLDE